MRIAIYNRWLHTLGGGERETAAFADVLRKEHEVELLTHQPVDLSLFDSRLNLPLPGVGVRVLPCDAALAAVSRASVDYDLFANFSHGDFVVPRARHNLLRVFFPVAIEREEPAEDAPRLRLLDGFYEPESHGGITWAWTGARARALLPVHPAHAGGSPALICRVHGLRPDGTPPAEVAIMANGIGLGRRRLAPDGVWKTLRFPLPDRLRSIAPLEITLETSTFAPRKSDGAGDCRELGVAVAMLAVEHGGWLRRRVDDPEGAVPDTAAWTAMQRRMVLPTVESYQTILANSTYTQKWIGRRWGVDSALLYPPVAVEDPPAGTKQPLILSVGRFFPGQHNKKHGAMIDVFRSLCDAGLQGWEYHLAGGFDETQADHRAYLQSLQHAAAGYPVRFHVNAPYAELRGLYGSAAIFWHATGFDEDEEQHPDRLEHFGITTVEAMAAGCVPVVIARGGQAEIVSQGQDGYLWERLDDLAARTRRLIEHDKERGAMAAAARIRSRSFGMDAFSTQVHALIDRLQRQAPSSPE